MAQNGVPFLLTSEGNVFTGVCSSVHGEVDPGWTSTIGGTKGGARDARPSGSKFFNFYAVFGNFLTK